MCNLYGNCVIINQILCSLYVKVCYVLQNMMLTGKLLQKYGGSFKENIDGDPLGIGICCLVTNYQRQRSLLFTTRHLVEQPIPYRIPQGIVVVYNLQAYNRNTGILSVTESTRTYI